MGIELLAILGGFGLLGLLVMDLTLERQDTPWLFVCAIALAREVSDPLPSISAAGLAINGEDITIFGDGSQTRSFCYVDDLIDGFLAMMEGPEDLAGPVNLGNPQERTILDLAQRVLEKIESSSQLVTKPLPPDDPLQRRPDITLATDRLGWKPRVDLEEGLEATIEAFRGLDLEDWTPPTKYWQGPPLTD